MFRMGTEVDSQQFLDSLQNELRTHADPVFRARAAEYFGHNGEQSLGVRTPVVRRISAKYFQELEDHDIDRVLELCETLLQTEMAEYRTIAFDWAFRCRKQYRPEHFSVFERWLEVYVDSWGGCDDLCTHALGDIVLRYVEFLPRVREWAGAENRWLRRASAVSLICGARRGKLLPHIFDVADALLEDQDDIVQKGCGWLLKVASKRHEDEVFQYVMRNRDRMSRTILRYAIEKMPVDRRQQAMGKR
jgi:3-methyladenine DNA glycosylase AlkD